MEYLRLGVNIDMLQQFAMLGAGHIPARLPLHCWHKGQGRWHNRPFARG